MYLSAIATQVLEDISVVIIMKIDQVAYKLLAWKNLVLKKGIDLADGLKKFLIQEIYEARIDLLVNELKA